MKRKPSVDFSGYWQRRVGERWLANEIEAKNYEIFIGRNEYNFAPWTHS
jgi:hypothetical protein